MRRSNRSWQLLLLVTIAAVAWLAIPGLTALAASTAPQDLQTMIKIWDRRLGTDPWTDSAIGDLGPYDIHPGLELIGLDSSGTDLPEDYPVTGWVYVVDRAAGTIPVMPTPGVPPFMAYAPTPWPGAAKVDIRYPTGDVGSPGLDMRGWLTHQTAPYAIAGMSDPVEGWWTIHARSVVQTGVALIYGQTSHGQFLVDVTPPPPVSNLRLADNGSTIVSGGRIVLGRTRADFLWDNPNASGGSYDALSGDSRWRVTRNGEILFPPAGTSEKPTGDIRIVHSALYGSTSMERLDSGENSISVAVIDCAGNLGPESVLRFVVDGDSPQVSITRPAAGASAGGTSYKFSATATDSVQITSVTFKIDGKTLYTDTSSPHSLTKSMAGYAHGSYHTLSVTAKDLYGHTTTVNRTFRVDKVKPRLTMYGDSPDPFYPVLQDGYKDKSTIKFRIYERCTVTLQVFKSNGSLWRQSKSTKSAGLRSVTWDGKGKGSTVQTGTFYYRIGATDAAGNTTWSAKYPTHIRNYELKSTSDGGIQVIPR